MSRPHGHSAREEPDDGFGLFAAAEAQQEPEVDIMTESALDTKPNENGALGEMFDAGNEPAKEHFLKRFLQGMSQSISAHQELVAVLLLLVFFPAGIAYIWRRSCFRKSTRDSILIALVVLTIMLALAYASSIIDVR